MKNRSVVLILVSVLVASCILFVGTPSQGQSLGASPKVKKASPFVEEPWETVVNNSFAIPNGTRNFASYGQPSINKNGNIVFRARSTGGTHETGIYFSPQPKGKILVLADTNTLVPAPNNLETKFREFSSFPRMALNSPFTAFRGLHSPVYRYMLPDGTETRAGTTGLYTTLGNDELLFTGAAKLGAVPGFEFYGVPRPEFPFDAPLSFDVFPGGSAINDDGAIVFKGNWTEGGIGKTGIFVRRLIPGPFGGFDITQLLASSGMEVPNVPPSFRAVLFESTSPPSVAGDYAVFLGLDVELDPHFGGIYRVHLKGGPLEPLVEIGKPLPNSSGPNLTRIGEGLSYDGRFLAFWAAWGTEFRMIRLDCPVDGNRDLINFCNGIDPNSIYDPETQTWYQVHEVPVQQGIVVMDLERRLSWVVSSTATDFTDFVYWTYSGHVPGSDGDEDAEPPRWRGASFMAVSDGMVVFKARTAEQNKKLQYVNIVDGLYSSDPVMNVHQTKLLETGTDGAIVDPSLAPGSMPITGFGIERDGFRGDFLAITATMANAEAGWGGIYTKRMSRTPNVNLKSK